MEQNYHTIDLEIDFSKQMLGVLFGNPSMKKIKNALDKNNFNKLKPLVINSGESLIHNCLLYTIHYQLDKTCKKIIRFFYMDTIRDKKLDPNKNNSEIFKFCIYYLATTKTVHSGRADSKHNRKESSLKLLLELDIDVKVDDNYALIECCSINNCYMVKLLIEKGADVYARNSISIVKAAGNGFSQLVCLLLEHMENRKLDNIKFENYNPTNYDIALISAAKSNHIEIVLMLLNAGANASVNNWEILTQACQQGNNDIVSMCLDNGADPNMLDGYLIKKAVQYGHFPIVETLVNYKLKDEYACDISVDNSVALRWACYKGHYDIAKLLLESKNVDGTPRCHAGAENNDAQRLATKFGHQNILNLLYEHSII